MCGATRATTIQWGSRAGWSYRDVLPYFNKSEGLCLATRSRSTPTPITRPDRWVFRFVLPCCPAPREFVEAAEAAGIPSGDYNGRDRANPRVSFRCFRPRSGTANGRAPITRFLKVTETASQPHDHHRSACDAHSARRAAAQRRRVSCGCWAQHGFREQRNYPLRRSCRVAASAAAFGHRPPPELEAAGIACLVDSPHVGKHLKDHLQLGLFFHAPGVGVSMNEVGARRWVRTRWLEWATHRPQPDFVVPLRCQRPGSRRASAMCTGTTGRSPASPPATHSEFGRARASAWILALLRRPGDAACARLREPDLAGEPRAAAQ